MKKRSVAREKVLQALYQRDLTKDATSFDATLDSIMDGFNLRGALRDFAGELLRGVIENIDDIDAVIESHAEHWSKERMSVVDRNLLRLSVYELRYMKKTPYKVAINEAVGLAKRFGAEESRAFVNGILDRIAKEEKRTGTDA